MVKIDRSMLGVVAVGAMLAVAALAGCGGSTTRKTATSASTATPAATTPAATPTTAPTASTWSYPLPPSIVPTSATTTSATPTSASATATGSTAPSAIATAAPAAPPTTVVATSSTGAVLKGTIPADPTTSFTGTLFLVGERFVPGSSVVVSYQGTPVAVLPATFTSSEVLGVSVFFAAAGDFDFGVLAPSGASSTTITVPVKSAPTSSAFSFAPPAVKAVFPTSLDPSFAGTVWIMGEGFLPGATLLVSQNGGPPVPCPATFTNERTLGWFTAAPVAGTLTIQVLNPTFATSNSVGLQVKGAPSLGAGLPAPSLLLPPTKVSAPFVGTTRIFGANLLPGAVVELTSASGQVTTTPLLFVSSAEAWWVLAYPSVGQYSALVRNPDGQATMAWSFDVN